MKGIIIKESLSNELVLDLVAVDRTELWKAEAHTADQPKYWTALFFRSNSAEFPVKLSQSLKEHWYVDMNTESEKLIVLKDTVLHYRPHDVAGRLRAMEECRKHGVPESQLDWAD